MSRGREVPLPAASDVRSLLLGTVGSASPAVAPSWAGPEPEAEPTDLALRGTLLGRSRADRGVCGGFMSPFQGERGARTAVSRVVFGRFPERSGPATHGAVPPTLSVHPYDV